MVGGEQHGYGVMEGPSAPSTSEHNRGPKVSGSQDWWVTSMPDPCSATSQVRVVGVGGEVSVDVMEGLYLSSHLSIPDGDRSRPKATGEGEGQHARRQLPNLLIPELPDGDRPRAKVPPARQLRASSAVAAYPKNNMMPASRKPEYATKGYRLNTS